MYLFGCGLYPPHIFETGCDFLGTAPYLQKTEKAKTNFFGYPRGVYEMLIYGYLGENSAKIM
jgi:hypothetical protein